MPLVAAGLPVLEPAGVREHRRDLLRGQAGPCGHRRQLGEEGVLELLEPRGQQPVQLIGRLLGGAPEERLQHQHPVAEFALLADLPLVREQVVAQVHRIREAVAQHAQRPLGGDGGGHLGAHGVLDEPRRPGRAADLAALFHVLERIGDPADADVVELPQGLHQEIAGAEREAGDPVRRMPGDGPGPQVGEPRLDRVAGLRGLRGRVVCGRGLGHEQGQPFQRRAPARPVAAPLEDLQEPVVEEEHPHVPVGDQRKHRSIALGVGVGAQQRVVVRLQVGLLPYAGALQHAHAAGPVEGVRAGAGQVRIEAGGVRDVELGQFEGLRAPCAAHAAAALSRRSARSLRSPAPRRRRAPGWPPSSRR